ncbi:MAG: helix-turn-helix domain-containing protein [Bacteroidales bacterium]|nr:helix-turn-helix domain-containing protein [Bacteroidales bacterium]
MTPTQFADAIGIQRSSMSHILARRNNPSLDFVVKTLNRFPEINAEWLLTGKNQMFSLEKSAPTPPSLQEPKLNSKIPEFEWNNEIVDTDLPLVRTSTSVPKPTEFDTDYKSAPAASFSPPTLVEEHEKIPPATKRDSNQNSDIERIIVFFTDGTFKSYT